MALTIEAIDEQNILVGTTDYELEIDITDGTENTEFELTGPWEGFYYDWDFDNDLLLIKSDEVTRILQDAEWTLTATEGSQTATRTIIFNVVSVAPVIATVADQNIIKGFDYSLETAISNNPSFTAVDGLQVAMKFESGGEGVSVNGKLPNDANITQDEFIATITTSNNGGEHIRDVDFNIISPIFYGLDVSGTDSIFQINFNGIDEAVTINNVFFAGIANGNFIAVDENYFYRMQGATDRIYTYDRETVPGETAIATELLDSNISGTNNGIAVDNTTLYSAESTGTNRIFRWNKSDGSNQQRFNLPSTIGNARGIDIKNNDLIILDGTDNALYWVNKNTSNNATASITKSVYLPSPEGALGYYDITILLNKIYVVDESERILAIDIDTPNNTTLTDDDVDAYLLLPSTYSTLLGLAVYVQ